MTAKAESANPSQEGRPAHAWHLVIGLTLWFVWFSATYGGLAVACAVVPPPADSGTLNWLNASVLLLAAVTTAGFVAGAWISVRAARRAPAGAAGEWPRFVARTAAGLYVTAAVSTALVAMPALLVPPCV